MSKSISLLSALACTFIWGTTFIAQDTGMDFIGPYLFNAVRFFVGFLVLLPFFLLFENKNLKKELINNQNIFFKYSLLIGLFLFLGSALQQISLQYTDIANAAFFTIFYVPMVPIIVYFLFRDKIHWSNWPSVILCVIGGYLLTNFYDATIRKGDTLVVLGAIFWALHIIYVGKVIKNFNLPIFIGLIQTLTVSILSLVGAILFEEINIDGIFKQTYQILYAGILSGGFAFVLQIYAQKNINPTPAAIIFSLEGVIATIAAWFLLSQILNLNNIIGCIFIVLGVLISQIVPELKINKVKNN
jgi:drug/metabolite transporter (DMT)-like permease